MMETGDAPLRAGAGGWLEECLRRLEARGFAVLGGVLDPEGCAAVDAALLRAQAAVREEAGEEALAAARARGDAMIRFLEVHDPLFLGTPVLPPLLALVDRFLGPDAVLRFQMGNRAPPAGGPGFLPTQPHAWHRNFGRLPGVPRLSLEVAISLEDMTPETGCPVVVPGSHRTAGRPPEEVLAASLPLPSPAGAAVLLDGSLWHRETPNLDARERRILVLQFVPPWVKPYFDYPRMLGEERLRALPERTRRLFGWESRPPATSREFHAPAGERTWRVERPS